MAALEAYMHTPRLSCDLWPAQLDYLARAGANAPEWLIARWVREQAVRWMLVNADPRIDTGIVDALITHDLPEDFSEEWMGEYVSKVAGSDALCHDLALHAGGGLGDFIDLRASDELLARAGRVREWPNQLLGVYEFVDVERDVLTVRDLANGERRDLLHLGAITGLDREARVYGRIVPIETPPGAMFERRPIEVDPLTGRQLVAELHDGTVAGLMGILAAAALDGRMPWRPGTRVRTCLWSDALIVDERYEELAASEPDLIDSLEDSEWARRWIAQGVEPDVVFALATCQLALDLAERVPDALPVTATHAATNLSEPLVLEAAREHLTTPESADAWRTLAAYVQEPLRTQCHELAAIAADKSPAGAMGTPDG